METARSIILGVVVVSVSNIASAQPGSLAPPKSLPQTPRMVVAAAQPQMQPNLGGGFIEFLFEPWTIGQNVSSGCIRMRNADVIDLYERVKVGTKVVVL